MYKKLIASALLLTSQVAIADATTDANAVLQLVLNSPQLSQYYHFDVRPQRKPLRVLCGQHSGDGDHSQLSICRETNNSRKSSPALKAHAPATQFTPSP